MALCIGGAKNGIDKITEKLVFAAEKSSWYDEHLCKFLAYQTGFSAVSTGTRKPLV